MLLVTGVLNHRNARSRDAGKFDAVALDPSDARRMFAAGQDALWVSPDSGANWEEVNMLFLRRKPRISALTRTIQADIRAGTVGKIDCFR